MSMTGVGPVQFSRTGSGSAEFIVCEAIEFHGTPGTTTITVIPKEGYRALMLNLKALREFCTLLNALRYTLAVQDHLARPDSRQ